MRLRVDLRVQELDADVEVVAGLLPQQGARCKQRQLNHPRTRPGSLPLVPLQLLLTLRWRCLHRVSEQALPHEEPEHQGGAEDHVAEEAREPRADEAGHLVAREPKEHRVPTQ
eukprot:507505-Rhodomonas_salina.2